MNLRDDNGKIKSNVLIATVFAAMLVAMVTAVMAITTAQNIEEAEAQGVMDRPYVKAFAGSTALYEPNAGKTNVFGPGGIFPFFNDTFSCGDAITCGVQTDASFKGVFSEMGENAFVARYEAPITYGDH